MEIVSPCPTNVGLSPEENIAWIEDEVLRYFPLGVLRDRSGEEACQAGVCQSSGNPCEGGVECDEAGDTCACTENEDCNDSLACTTDSCDEGSCVNEVNANWCLIDQVCYSDGATRPTN